MDDLVLRGKNGARDEIGVPANPNPTIRTRSVIHKPGPVRVDSSGDSHRISLRNLGFHQANNTTPMGTNEVADFVGFYNPIKSPHIPTSNVSHGLKMRGGKAF
ncbi:hypothetical protein Nepgr_015786 [Nepenthes gracilis]|uniref:Uncharacterized protein n=1 Tax=Nepenthes gracilis TaxID=150966 RepID=A0AAD3SNG9_NEPGR|nr:hypothetical protein Nepgr_015786 [Nepenthes gracilis]